MILSQWIGKKPNGLIGLDIGSDSIKLLKIKAKENAYKVENFATTPLPANVLVKGEIKDFAAITDALDTLLKKAANTTQDCAIAIPRSSTIIKNITIDNRLSADDMESRAWIEANRHFPDLVGDIYLDFAVLGPSAQDTTQNEFILVACRKDQIDPYLELVKSVGLHPKIVDVNSYALARAMTMDVQAFQSFKTVALLNLDYSLSTLVVMHENNLIYAHDESFDARRLMNQVNDYQKDADKKNYDDPQYLQSLKDALSAHLRHTMHFFYSSRPNLAIERLIVSGDCAVIPKLASTIQDETGVDTSVADPFANIAVDTFIDQDELKKNAPALMLCCGLALSKTDAFL